MNADTRLAEILEIHFDPRWGAPYWLERRESLGFDPLRDISTVSDLRRFPAFPREDLVRLPVDAFIPRRYSQDLADFVTAETGGTTGPPARTIFRADEFHAAFVAPFLAAADFMVFPPGLPWLFIGPSGPHPIGKAARLCATAMGSIDPFTVDFDPRWARSLRGFALERYLEHVLAQALDLLNTQFIGVLFTTPPVLRALGERLSENVRLGIFGIHTGGMTGDAAFWRDLAQVWFPRAKVMSGYGNSLAGMCPQLAHDPLAPPEYFPHQTRLVWETLAPDARSRGQLCFHRLDESCFIPHMLERDEAELIKSPEAACGAGFSLPGLRDPQPLSAGDSVQTGLY